VKERLMLSESELTKFRDILNQERTELNARLRTLDRRLARDDHFNEAEDLGDSANQVLNKEEFLFERNQTEERLREIEKALARIKDGSYGVSKVSGKPIPVERLRAMPTATTLVGE
jgi:RNA polymerase-binding transcription factor DksA